MHGITEPFLHLGQGPPPRLRTHLGPVVEGAEDAQGKLDLATDQLAEGLLAGSALVGLAAGLAIVGGADVGLEVVVSAHRDRGVRTVRVASAH